MVLCRSPPVARTGGLSIHVLEPVKSPIARCCYEFTGFFGGQMTTGIAYPQQSLGSGDLPLLNPKLIYEIENSVGVIDFLGFWLCN